MSLLRFRSRLAAGCALAAMALNALWPLLASGARLVIAAGGGWLAMRWYEGGIPTLFTAIAVALIVYVIIVARAMQADAWRTGTTAR